MTILAWLRRRIRRARMESLVDAELWVDPDTGIEYRHVGAVAMLCPCGTTYDVPIYIGLADVEGDDRQELVMHADLADAWGHRFACAENEAAA